MVHFLSNIQSHATDFFQVVDGVCRVSSGWPSKEVKTVFGIRLLFFQLFIPFIVLTVCYGKILWVLSRRINTDFMKTKHGNSEHISEPTPDAKIVKQTTNTANYKFQLARRNTIKTLLIVGLCFIICWSQNQIIYFIYNCGYELDFNNTYYQYTILMVFVNCTVNPFIYLIKYRDDQETLRTFFHCQNEQEDNRSFS